MRNWLLWGLSLFLFSSSAPAQEVLKPDTPATPKEVIVRHYEMYPQPDLGACVALFEPRGSSQAYLTASLGQGAIIVGVYDTSLGLTSSKQYDVAVKRGDTRILEYGIGYVDNNNVTSMKAIGIGTALYMEPLKKISLHDQGDFSYSIVAKGKDVELFHLSNDEFELVMVELMNCTMENQPENIWDQLASPKTKWTIPRQQTPEELGLPPLTTGA